MDVIGNPAHRQRIQIAPARFAVEQGGDLDRVGIEQVQDRAKDARQVDELAVISPARSRTLDKGAEQEVGRRARLKGALGLLQGLILCWLDELDLFAGLLLEGCDDFAERLIRLGIEAPFPPHHEVGGPGAEGRDDQRGGKDNGANSRHGRLPEVIAQHTPIAAASVAPIPHFRLPQCRCPIPIP